MVSNTYMKATRSRLMQHSCESCKLLMKSRSAAFSRQHSSHKLTCKLHMQSSPGSCKRLTPLT